MQTPGVAENATSGVFKSYREAGQEMSAKTQVSFSTFTKPFGVW